MTALSIASWVLLLATGPALQKPIPRLQASQAAPAAARPTIQAVPTHARGSEPVTAFVDVSVIPMDRERVLAHQTVVVRGGRIVALGRATRVPVPAGATRVDGRGKYLIPGLADMHVHLPTGFPDNDVFSDTTLVEAESELALLVANGVTTIRIMHGWPQTLALRDRVARGELLGPRLYVARRAIELEWGKGWADSAPRIAEDVEAAKAAGYDLYKVHGAIKGGTAAHDSLVAAARRVGLPIAGHVPGSNSMEAGSQSLAQAVAAGYASVEHLIGFREAVVDSTFLAAKGDGWYPTTEQIDQRKLQALAARMRRAGVWTCPTLNHMTADGAKAVPLEQWPELAYLSDGARQAVAERGRGSAVMVDSASRDAQVEFYRTVVRALRDAGAGLLLGTDTPLFRMVGFAVHYELVGLVRAGLTPYEALATGTRNAAEYFHTLDSTGTVAVGKRADLVLLNGNPLHNIWITAHPAGVMVNGRWLDRAELDARLSVAVASSWIGRRMGR